MEFVNTPGTTRNLAPQAVVLLDPATGLPIVVSATKDSTGAVVNPDSWAHTFAYAAGLLLTDTGTDSTSTWIKTYSYTSGVLTGETKWVKQ